MNKIDLDQRALARRLAPLLETPACRDGITTLAGDPFLIAYFLASVSQGEGLGEAAVGMIGQEELAHIIRELAADLERQRLEEQGHKEQTLDAAQELFPELFEDGRYRYQSALGGQPYYVAVLESNRRRLKELAHYSRLNLYLTTTFAYEVMVVLLYRAVADAIAASAVAAVIRDRVVPVLERILAEEETHLGVIDQHQALLEAPRGTLSGDARAMLGSLETLEVDDYEYSARLAVEQVAAMMSQYADAAGHRTEIEAGRIPGPADL